MNRSIQPLGEQIIIRTIPKDSIGSILIPDSAKGITMMGEKGAEDAVHFVEAEVIAVGPGKRGKGLDPALVFELASALQFLLCRQFPDADAANAAGYTIAYLKETHELAERAERYCDTFGCNWRIPLTVKPGDRILYHPSVQKFDRRVEGLGEGEYFIIREDSVLAVIEE